MNSKQQNQVAHNILVALHDVPEIDTVRLQELRDTLLNIKSEDEAAPMVNSPSSSK